MGDDLAWDTGRRRVDAMMDVIVTLHAYGTVK